MSNILLLDLGNSRLKWAVYPSTKKTETAIQTGILNNADASEEKMQAEWQALPAIKAAYIAAVGQSAIQQRSAKIIKAQQKITLQQIQVAQSCAGVQNSYTDITKLGVDRWMGLLAVHSIKKNDAIIVSCGTATTIDIIDASGQYQGGYIVPGISLMQQSLATATADKNIHQALMPAQQIQPGKDTDAAISNGIVQMQVALIEKIMAENQNNPTDLYITGGAAKHITPFLSVPYQLELDLVYKGMLVHIHAQ